MTTPHRTLQMALDALDAITDDVDGTGLNTMPSFDKALDAIAALREALNAPEPEPYGHVTTHTVTGQQFFYRYPSPPYLDTAKECIAVYAAPPAAPADDHATPSGGQEAGPQEDRIEAAYWRFDARHKGYSQWKTAPMSERDAFKAEMRNALEAEKVRAEMRLVARGWRRPDAPAAPASQWMPIETAPKDGAYVLVSNPEAGGTWVAKYMPFAVSGYKFDDPWRGMMLNHDHMPPKTRYLPPTHWMPLPAAPGSAPPAAPAPVVREPQPEPVQRLMRFAGKKRSEVSNPCLTAREAIVIADWMQAHGITGGSK